MSLKITQTRSLIGSSDLQRRTIHALGLRRIRHTVTHRDTPVIRGMLRKVSHLIHVEETTAEGRETQSNI